MGKGFALRVWGDYACFTRPEMKVERVSYDVITPSAARNIYQAIYWKPQIQWIIDRIHVLKPVRFTNIRRNELNAILGAGTVKTAMNDGTSPVEIFVDDSNNRAQRAGVVLRDVDYVIEAHFEETASGDGNHGKHADMFRRRVENGQCFNQPYLGTREFSASFELVTGEMPTSELTGEQDFGFMLFDIDFKNDMTPMFYRPVVNDGIIEVPRPDSPEVLR